MIKNVYKAMLGLNMTNYLIKQKKDRQIFIVEIIYLILLGRFLNFSRKVTILYCKPNKT